MKNKNFNMINKLKLLCHSELVSESLMKQLKPAFTLAEVLLATAIVGIIAGLVLPTTITKVQNRGFDQAYERNVQAVADAINSLIVIENKDFFKTEMYKDTAPSSYDNTSGTFLKNYMKVSKYCGSGLWAKNCFADKYYQYNQNKKEVYEPNYTGACAILKNGASICLIPQIGTEGPKGIIDLNGKKGPNVFGRDIREFAFIPKTRFDKDKTQNGVLVTFAPDLGLGKTECEKDSKSLACCKTKTITSDQDDCCNYPEIKATTPACTPPDPCETNPTGLECCKKGVTEANKNDCCNNDEIKSKIKGRGHICCTTGVKASVPACQECIHGQYLASKNLCVLHLGPNTLWSQETTCSNLNMRLPNLEEMRSLCWEYKRYKPQALVSQGGILDGPDGIWWTSESGTYSANAQRIIRMQTCGHSETWDSDGRDAYCISGPQTPW